MFIKANGENINQFLIDEKAAEHAEESYMSKVIFLLVKFDGSIIIKSSVLSSSISREKSVATKKRH